MRQFAASTKRAPLVAVVAVPALCALFLHHSIAVTQTSILFLSDEWQQFPPADGDAGVHEPYADRWQRRFVDAGGGGGIVFFKHIRKAGGTAVRNYLHAAMKHHGFGTLDQFLERNGRDEVRRHFPFLNSRQRQYATRFSKQAKQTKVTPAGNTTRVYYIEQEWSTMDWRCRNVDQRWNDSLSIIVLRHPIERHMSEYFYSGPLAKGKFEGHQFGIMMRGNIRISKGNKLEINRTKLYSNKTYTHALSMFLQKDLQSWAAAKTQAPVRPGRPGIFKWYFGQHYTDNFQLRALAGCASGGCLDRKSVSDKHLLKKENRYPPYPPSPDAAARPIDSVCTMHPFYAKNMSGACMKTGQVCQGSCDGPCLYPAVAWGALDRDDLRRAMHSLEGFDVVLLTETLDNSDQLALLADVLGVPRDVTMGYAAGRMNDTTFASNKLNINNRKEGRRERTHYYRDLMSNLTYPHLMNSIKEENKLDIELYNHAVRLNKQMTERWKREVQWRDKGELVEGSSPMPRRVISEGEP